MKVEGFVAYILFSFEVYGSDMVYLTKETREELSVIIKLI